MTLPFSQVENLEVSTLFHYLQNFRGSSFKRKVYNALFSIPYGETRSYEWLARKIGKPKAARAIGRALKENPLPIIIPCHRIIKKDGTLGGYILGEKTKKNLLELEKAPVAQYGRAAVS